MTLTKSFKDPVVWLAIAIISFLCFDKCSSSNENMQLAQDLAGYKDTAMDYRAKNGILVSYNQAIEADYITGKKLIDSLQGYLKNLRIKDPAVIVRTNTVVHIDTILVQFRDTLPCDDFTRNYKIDSTWYKTNITLTNKSLLLSGLTIPNRQETVIGTKKNGFFKRNEYVVAVTNTNPHISVQSLGAITFKPKVAFYDKLWFKATIFAAGFIAGSVIH